MGQAAEDDRTVGGDGGENVFTGLVVEIDGCLVGGVVHVDVEGGLEDWDGFEVSGVGDNWGSWEAEWDELSEDSLVSVNKSSSCLDKSTSEWISDHNFAFGVLTKEDKFTSSE